MGVKYCLRGVLYYCLAIILIINSYRMKASVLASLCMVMALAGSAQKPPLSLNDCVGWPILRLNNISNDGKYFIYNYRPSSSDSVAVCSTDGKMQTKFGRCLSEEFSDDSRKAVLELKMGICLMDL